MKDTNVIKCPECGTEYLPAEIFVPNAFFGKPNIIKRDTEGNILDYSGKGLDTEECFTCDKCNSTFNVKATISFDSYIVEEANFAKEYVSPPPAKFKIEAF